jgi:hypothetical protein
MKKVSSKILKTAPFVERRIRDDPFNDKGRRAVDIPPANVQEGQAINSATYKVASGKLRPSEGNSPGGLILDCYV